MGLNCSQCGLRYKPGDTVCHADGSALVESDDELLGETIGNYRIVRLLGEGGMGRVYLGLHPRIGSRVAVKLLSPQASTDDELVQRFFSEAQLVNKVRHEGIVNVLDLDQLPDGRPFIIMEFLDGAPLSAVIAEGPMAMPRAVRIGIEILEALDAAHACGVVHRDLKPDNIFITPKGRVKLLDFGIAKLMPEFQTTVSGPATRTGALLGTPGYMAPEQVTGEEISGATDVYAVGAILFEALTGSMAFAAGTLFELLRRIVSDPPPPMRERRPDLAPALEAVVVCALQKSPAARFGSAAAMAGALRNVLKSFGPEALVAAAEPILVPAHPGRTPTPRELALGSEATLAPGALAPPQNLALGSEATVFPSPIANAKEREAAAFAETQHSVSRDDAAALAKTQHSLAQPPAGTMPVPGREQRYSEVPNMAGAGAAQTASQAKSRRGVFVAGAALATAGALAVALLAGGDQETAPTAAAAPSFDAGVVASLPSGAEAEPADAGARNGDAATADTPTIGAAGEPRTAKRPPRATTKTGTTTPSSIPSEPEPAAPALDAGHVVLKAHPSKGEFHIKPDFNPKAFDGAAYVPKARKLAKRLYADAVLTEFDVEGVAANGLADLTLSSFEATYMFRSPSHSKRTLPIGVDDERPCWVYVEVDKSGVTTRIVTRDECKGAARPNPKCSMREVWKRSDSLGMPPQKKGALAHVTYLWDGWFFDIDPLNVTGSIPDDC